MEGKAGVDERGREGYSVLALAAIFSLFTLTNINGVPNPALNDIAALFPDESFGSVSFISTLPSLTMLPFTLLAGTLVSRGIRYKVVAAVGLILLTVPSVTCYFLHSLGAILACRALFGAGFGLVTALGNPLLIQGYSSERRSTFLGLGTAFWYAGSILFYLVSGWVAARAPMAVFLIYGIGILPLALVLLGLPEPPRLNEREESGKLSETSVDEESVGGFLRGLEGCVKVDFPILCVILLVFGIAFFPWLIGMSAIVAEKGIGDASFSGVVLAVNSVGAVIAGLSTGTYVKTFKRFSLPVALMALGLTLLATNVASTPVVLLVLSVFGGYFLGMPIALCNVTLGNMVPPSRVPVLSNVLFVFFNLGGFLCSFWMSALGVFQPGMGLVLTVGGTALCALALVAGWLKARGRLLGAPGSGPAV